MPTHTKAETGEAVTLSDDNETRDRQPEGRRPAWQSGTPRGQERVVSYESDERYWTDYLRVALPVLGLLLMLGLLFVWASSIIGDDRGSQPTSTVAPNTQVAVADTTVPVDTVEAGLTPDPITETPDTGATEPPGDGTEEPTEAPTTGDDTPTNDGCDSDFKRGDAVRTTEEGARFRQEADLSEDNPPTLPAETPLTIVSDCYRADGDNLFWLVSDEDGEEGYVAESLFELIPPE